MEALYKKIASAMLEDGSLPVSFSVHTDKNEPKAHDGAMDGWMLYHMDTSASNGEGLFKAIDIASKGDFEKALAELLSFFNSDVLMVSLMDPVQKYVYDNQKKLSLDNIYGFCRYILMERPEVEPIKFALTIMEILYVPEDKLIHKIVEILAGVDELTFFALAAMSRGKQFNGFVYRTAVRTHGWGRIHAVERLEPVNDTVKNWLLIEGCHNYISPKYSALTVAKKIEADKIASGNPDDIDMKALTDIIEGLLGDVTVKGMESYPASAELMMGYLSNISKMVPADYLFETAKHIRDYAEASDGSLRKRGDIIKLADSLTKGK